MKRIRCLTCKTLGMRPKRGSGMRIVFDPQITMPGPPTLDGDRLSAEMIADIVWHQGMEEAVTQYDLARGDVLVACWWAGWYGPRRFKAAWKQWAEAAHLHLWYGCANVEDPPRKQSR